MCIVNSLCELVYDILTKFNVKFNLFKNINVNNVNSSNVYVNSTWKKIYNVKCENKYSSMISKQKLMWKTSMWKCESLCESE